MPSPPATVGATIEEEDELDELPPLDGDVRDPPEPDVDVGDALDENEGEGLDDATGEDDPADADGLDLEEGERDRAWLDEPADTPDLDLGDAATLVDLGEEGGRSAATDEPEAADRPGGVDEDFGFGATPERGGLEGDDEGPVDADEELREADLPRLDADEEGEMDEAVLVEAGFAADEPVALPWASEPWPRVGAPVAVVAATMVVCAPRGALVAGTTEGGAVELLRVDLEGTSQSLAASGLEVSAVERLAVEGERVAVVAGQRAMLSRDGGASFAPVAEGVHATDVALVSGALWMRTAEGELAVAGEGGVRVVRAPEAGGGVVAALACDAPGGLAVLVTDDTRRASTLVRVVPGADPVDEALGALPELRRGPPLVAVRGAHVAFAGRDGGVIWREPGGGWAARVWEGVVTALAFVDDAGTLVAATYSEVDDTTSLVRLAGIGGEGTPQASVVARIGASRPCVTYGEGAEGEAELQPDRQEGRVLALTCDDARGVVWVAGGFGVTAFALR